MEKCKFIGACHGKKEETGNPWFVVFLARWSEKFGAWTCWSSYRIEEDEYSEFGCLKFGDEIEVHFFNAQIKKYVIPTPKK